MGKTNIRELMRATARYWDQVIQGCLRYICMLTAYMATALVSLVNICQLDPFHESREQSHSMSMPSLAASFWMLLTLFAGVISNLLEMLYIPLMKLESDLSRMRSCILTRFLQSVGSLQLIAARMIGALFLFVCRTPRRPLFTMYCIVGTDGRLPLFGMVRAPASRVFAVSCPLLFDRQGHRKTPLSRHRKLVPSGAGTSGVHLTLYAAPMAGGI